MTIVFVILYVIVGLLCLAYKLDNSVFPLSPCGMNRAFVVQMFCWIKGILLLTSLPYWMQCCSSDTVYDEWGWRGWWLDSPLLVFHVNALKQFSISFLLQLKSSDSRSCLTGSNKDLEANGDIPTSGITSIGNDKSSIVNHSGTNGSIITMTMKNNHLIVETEERNVSIL